MNISLQLYSVKVDAGKDFKGTIKRVAEIGYDGVEFAGFGGLNAAEQKAWLDSCGLYAKSSHCDRNLFETALDETLAYNRDIGAKYMILPSPCGRKLQTKSDVDEMVSLLNHAAEKAEAYGLKIGYHNHALEFEKIDGEYILDHIAKGTVDNVALQLDVYWASYAGVDPIEYIKKFGSKIELIHLKQIGAEKKNVCLPDGRLDMAQIVKTAVYSKEFTVEQEPNSAEGESDIWNMLKRNVEYMKGLIL